jgi:hypothetical protein
MFKHILVVILSSICSYLLMLYLLKKNYKRFYFINGITKYPLKCTIKKAILISLHKLKDLDNFIFYSKETINGENYIYDQDNDYYYVIEPNYYYYINKSKSNCNLVINCNENSSVYMLKLN